MDVAGQVLQFLVVMLLLATLLIAIPSLIGQDAGSWVVRRYFPAWPIVDIERSSFWGLFVHLLVVAALIALSVVVFGVPRINIFEVLLARQWQEVWDGMHYVIQLVISFFLAGFVSTFFACWYQHIKISKTGTGTAQPKTPVTAIVMAKGVFYAYFLSLIIVLISSMVIRHTVGVTFLDALPSYTLHALFLVSVFFGAAYVTKRLDVKGWLYGGIFGLIHLVGLLAVIFGIITPTYIDEFNVGSIAVQAFMTFISGAAGGILGRLISNLNRDTPSETLYDRA